MKEELLPKRVFLLFSIFTVVFFAKMKILILMIAISNEMVPLAADLGLKVKKERIYSDLVKKVQQNSPNVTFATLDFVKEIS